jgi:hypothetical protein
MDTPLNSAGLRQTQGGVADVRLRTTGGGAELPSATAAHAAESGPALRVFLSAAVVVVAGVGAFWLYTQKKAAQPQSVSSEPTAASAPATAGTAAAAATPSSAAPEPSTAPGPTTAAPAAAPSVAIAAEPTEPPKPSGPVTVTFRSNQVATLTVDGKKQGSVLPAGTRLSLKPGAHTAVFEVPGFMKLPPQTFDVGGPDTKAVTAVFPAKGQVVLTVSPPGAEIRIDGVSAGSASGAPLKKFLAAGPHEIVVSLAGYRTETKAVDLDEEAQSSYRIDLKKE